MKTTHTSKAPAGLTYRSTRPQQSWKGAGDLADSGGRRSSHWLGLAGLLYVATACETNYYTTHVHPGEGPLDASSSPVADASRGDADATDNSDTDTQTDAGTAPGVDAAPPDAGTPSFEPEPSTDAGDGGVDAGAQPLVEGAPLVNSSPRDQALDVFGTTRNHYWFVASDEHVQRMNARYDGNGPIWMPGLPGYGDMYTPGGSEGGTTFADHLLVTDAAGKTADYGKIEVRLVGESTGRAWTEHTLPNFRLDADEFTQKHRIGQVEHLRLNNAIVGSIFREKFTLDLYRALGYPAPRATYGRVSGTVWEPGTAVPYVVVEVYKKPFCKRWESHFGGGCLNMWEVVGDFGWVDFEDPVNCQLSQCDNGRIHELEALVLSTPEGPGYKEALSEWLDWDAFHQFQCLSWLFATGDDALHNTNNVVIVEREDGKFQYLPYSVDISFGQEWYRSVPLGGNNSIARGCQNDEQCWADTIATCETLLEAFVEADPLRRLERLHNQLAEDEMLRPGDEGRYEELKQYIERRLEELPEELELNRDAPHGVDREYPFVLCGDYCALPEECYLCEAGGESLLPLRPALNRIVIAPPPSTGPGYQDAGVDEFDADGGYDVPPPQTCLPWQGLYTPN